MILWSPCAATTLGFRIYRLYRVHTGFIQGSYRVHTGFIQGSYRVQGLGFRV